MRKTGEYLRKQHPFMEDKIMFVGGFHWGFHVFRLDAGNGDLCVSIWKGCPYCEMTEQVIDATLVPGSVMRKWYAVGKRYEGSSEK